MRNNNQTQGQKRGRNRNNNNRRGGGGGGGGGGGSNRNTFDSNGPNVRIRGSASQIYDKYATLARDASSSGDRVLAENLLQHAEHYYRLANPAQDGQSSQRRFQQSDNDSDMRTENGNDNDEDSHSNNKNNDADDDDNDSSDDVVIIDTTPREIQPDSDDSEDTNDTAGGRPAESSERPDDTPAPKRGRGRPRKVKAVREPQTPAELAEAVADQ